MNYFKDYQEKLTLLEQGRGEYTWDELEELITNDFDDDHLTSQQFDDLMRRLMDIDCG